MNDSPPLRFLVQADSSSNEYGTISHERVVCQALQRLGHTVLPWTIELADAQLPPDVDCLLVSHLVTPLDLFEELRRQLVTSGGVMVQWIYDLVQREPGIPIPEQPYCKRQGLLEAAGLMDLVFSKEPHVVDLLVESGIDARRLDQGVALDYLPAQYLSEIWEDPRFDGDVRDWAFRAHSMSGGPPPEVVRALPEWKCDVAFAGSATTHRTEALKRIAEIASVKVFGKPAFQEKWEKAGFDFCGPAFGRDLARLAMSAKIIFGKNYNKVPGYWSNRIWNTLAAKGFLLADDVPGLDQVVADRSHLYLYRDVDHALELIRLMTADEKREQRDRVRQAGFEHVVGHHLIEHRCRDVLVPAVRERIGSTARSGRFRVPDEEPEMRTEVIAGMSAKPATETIGSSQPDRSVLRGITDLSRAHIVFCAPNVGIGRGGGEISMMTFLQFLAERGALVTVVGARQIGVVPPPLKLVALEGSADPDLGNAIADLWPRPDVLVCDANIMEAVAVVGRTLRIPFVAVVQFWRHVTLLTQEALQAIDDDMLGPEHVDKQGVKILKAAAGVIANSELTEHVIYEAAGVECLDICYPPLTPTKLNLNAMPVQEREFVLCPSSQHGKGALVFLELARRHPDQRFMLLAGDEGDSDRPATIAQAKQCPNVELIDAWVEDMDRIYDQTRCVFLGTQTSETFSRVAAEATMRGIPLVASDVGNLRTIVTKEFGVRVPRGSDVDVWDDALQKALALRPDPTEEWNRDHRVRFRNAIDAVRLLSEVAIFKPGGLGVEAASRHLAAVLGVTLVDDFHDHRPGLGDYGLSIIPGGFTNPGDRVSGKIGFWWCSDWRQMDISRNEIGGLLEALGYVRTHAGAHLLTTSADLADSLTGQGWPHVHWLPACLDLAMTRETTKLEGTHIFLPGPYGPRKNIYQALAVAAGLKADLHVTGLIVDAEGFQDMAWALGVNLHVHHCPRTEDVLTVAGQCQVGLSLSMAETYGYGIAECILAGTPVVVSEPLKAICRCDIYAWFCTSGCAARPYFDGPSRADWQVPTTAKIPEIASMVENALGKQDDLLTRQRKRLEVIATTSARIARKALLGILDE